MNRKQFGMLVATLRKEHLDSVEGRSWTQKILADKTGLSQRTIEDIERGIKSILDGNTLVRLADAFNLTPLERMKFISLATDVNSADILMQTTSPEQLFAEVKQYFQGTRLPAVVYDPFFNIVLVNSTFLRFHGAGDKFFDATLKDHTKFNMLRFFFDQNSPLLTTLGFIPEIITFINVQYFRYLSFEYRYTEHFAKLLADLYKYPDFPKFWEAIKYEQHNLFGKWREDEYFHQQLGPVKYIAVTSVLMTLPYELYLSVYVPKNQQTQEMFENLLHEVGTVVQHLTPWPHA